MRSIGYMAGAALAIIATSALAQSPYAITGLHTELVFTAAVAQAEKLGGQCQITTSGMQDGGTSAQCEYAPCSARNQDGSCELQDAGAAGLTIALQPIVRIGLEAPTDTSRLARIVILFEGSHEIVAKNLRQEFGPADSDATSSNSNEKSWSHSQRLNWTQGPYRMGLLDSPQLIILATDRTQE